MTQKQKKTSLQKTMERLRGRRPRHKPVGVTAGAALPRLAHCGAGFTFSLRQTPISGPTEGAPAEGAPAAAAAEFKKWLDENNVQFAHKTGPTTWALEGPTPHAKRCRTVMGQDLERLRQDAPPPLAPQAEGGEPMEGLACLGGGAECPAPTRSGARVLRTLMGQDLERLRQDAPPPTAPQAEGGEPMEGLACLGGGAECPATTRSRARVRRSLRACLLHAAATQNADLMDTLLQLCVGGHCRDVTVSPPVVVTAVVIDVLIRRHQDFSVTSAGRSVLHSAARTGNAGVMGKLLALGQADVNGVTGCSRETPLHIAARYGNMDCLKMLLQHDACVDCRDHYERTPIHHAALRGHPEMVQCLADHSAEVAAVDKDGMTSWLHVLASRHVALAGQLKSLQEKSIVPSRHRFSDERTYLHLAAANGVVEAVRELLASGADPEARDSQGDTPLMAATRALHYPSVTILLDSDVTKASCDVNKINYVGQDAMFMALEAQGFEIVGVLIAGQLLRFGASVNRCYPDTGSLLHRHIHDKFKVDWLLRHGACPDLGTAGGATPLHAALMDERVPSVVVHTLLARNADLSFRTSHLPEAATPLVVALMEGRVVEARTLYLAGCSLKGVETWMGTPQCAEMRRSDPALDRFLTHLRSEQGPLGAPASLQDAARLAVLRTLGHPEEIRTTIDALPIPKALQNFLDYRVYHEWKAAEEGLND